MLSMLVCTPTCTCISEIFGSKYLEVLLVQVSMLVNVDNFPCLSLWLFTACITHVQMYIHRMMLTPPVHYWSALVAQ